MSATLAGGGYIIYTFLDTGVLDELLTIPSYYNEERSKQIKIEFNQRIKKGEKLIIPFAAMIEIGNHIAQIKNNTNERKRCAAQFAEFLDKSRNNKAPWILCTDGLTDDQIGFISDHFGEIGADMQIGTGDISIVYQYDKFRERVLGTAEGVEIWSLAHHILNLQRRMGSSLQSEKEVRRRRSR